MATGCRNSTRNLPLSRYQLIAANQLRESWTPHTKWSLRLFVTRLERR
jgi:hypothetical protein